jgi:hypothetical protein
MANEKRLIYANELLDEMHSADERQKTDVWLTSEIEYLLAEQPTVDAVEVVRCKDCKHFVKCEPYDPCECMKWKVKFGVAYTTPDGYCHKAERKDND